ncbi:hypothetical protein ACPPVT_17670 [Angustibacter sp. McL0619]|uniref:hypothetical protein n=1 Tax=Angustibacter sp. McL0619 TaxID=3415676 RepID=UPI003CEBCD86
MVIRATTVTDLLDRADAERTAGKGESAAALYDQAAGTARAEGDLAGWTRAVLGAASVYVFGAEPGRLPAQLYDVLVRTEDVADRARLAAALARCWAYAGHPERGAPFAAEAIERAERVGAADMLADCLDAALAVHWGPDELEVRQAMVRRLDEVAAHVLDPDARLQAHLWALQVACEVLDVQAIHRQMRALERLGEESARALFFAASRRLMLDLLRGRTDTAEQLMAVAADAGDRAGLADAWLVLKAMDAYSAAQSGNTRAVAEAAEQGEAFALAEGVPAVCAEMSYLWVCADRLDRARALVHTFRGSVLAELPRDVNWLLTLQCILEAALAVGDDEVIETAASLLAPYEGRAVMNAGAVMFHGLTDDTLARAAAHRGDHESADRLRASALATYDRVGAQWWRDRLASWRPPARKMPVAGVRSVHLHPLRGGLWQIGPDEDAVTLRSLRGFGYLRELVRRPHQPLSALDLVGSGTGVVLEAGLGELADPQALAAYRQRLRELEVELAEATDWSDLGRAETARTERDALLDEVARSTGLHGRPRTTGSSQERARVAVQKAIAGAVDRIGTVDERLGQHLRTRIRTGLQCTYEPTADDRLEWILDSPPA